MKSYYFPFSGKLDVLVALFSWPLSKRADPVILRPFAALIRIVFQHGSQMFHRDSSFLFDHSWKPGAKRFSAILGRFAAPIRKEFCLGRTRLPRKYSFSRGRTTRRRRTPSRRRRNPSSSRLKSSPKFWPSLTITQILSTSNLMIPIGKFEKMHT